MKTLVLYFHPHPEKSKRSMLIVDTLEKMPNVTVRKIANIYEKSKGLIETEEQIKEEQSILVQYDQIAFLFPIYWYAIPAMGKHYIDNVFALNFGYAYDRSLLKLAGKKLMIITSTGGPKVWYVEGMNGDPEKICYPFKSACFTSGMIFKKPMFFFGDSDIIEFSKALDAEMTL